MRMICWVWVLMPVFSAATFCQVSPIGRADSADAITHGPGTVLDLLLRVVGPLLLAFAVLALRGRTKR